MPDPNNIDVKHSKWIVDYLIKPGQKYYQEKVATQSTPDKSEEVSGKAVSIDSKVVKADYKDRFKDATQKPPEDPILSSKP